jgi:hypothetical protein
VYSGPGNPLPYVAAGVIDRIPIRGEPAMGILQTARQSVLLVWHGNEMNVIRHQAIADQLYPVSLDALPQQIEVDAPLSITFENEATRIAALSYVMGNAWSNHTSESNHSSTCPSWIRWRAGVEAAGHSSAVHFPKANAQNRSSDEWMNFLLRELLNGFKLVPDRPSHTFGG